jgi:TetR/AcrR family transcriptional repressor of nem operon
MTRPPTKKEQTRARILDAASQSFRSSGYAGTGVDGVAKAAGVTSGAFYAHFGSKDGAFAAALATGMDEVIEAIPKFQTERPGWTPLPTITWARRTARTLAAGVR